MPHPHPRLLRLQRQRNHPVIELLARYRAILRAAWEHRTELAGPSRMANEVAFLPAALSLQETPVHPAPRRLALLIIVSDRTKVIQPLEAGVVESVLVRDGDRVQAGQVLIELDPTMATADKANVQERLSAAISDGVVRAPSSRADNLAGWLCVNADPGDCRELAITG